MTEIKQIIINAEGMKSIMVSRSLSGDKTILATHVSGGYTFVSLDDKQVDKLIAALNEFKKMEVAQPTASNESV